MDLSNPPDPPWPYENSLDKFEIVYQGPEVEDGSMDASQLALALTGMTRAFSTAASEAEYGDRFGLRVLDIRHESFHIILAAIDFAKANPAAATAIAAGAAVALNAFTNMTSGAYRVIADIAKYIDAKKRLKGMRAAIAPTSFEGNTVNIALPDDIIVLTKEQYELLLSQKLDKPVSQIVAPLMPNRVDSMQFLHSGKELVSVEASERSYLEVREISEERIQDGTELIGTLNSLSKNNLRGTFYTVDGIHVPYRYVGGDLAGLLRGFSAREPVRVHGVVRYGGDGIPNQVEIQEIQVLQRGFFQ